MTTDQPEFLDGAQTGLPITYSKTKVPKEVIDDSTLWEADIKSFNNRIGFITNCSTTLYSMLEDDNYSEEEKQELISRLKICRKEQGNQIDKAKGLIVKPFPKSWTRKITTKDVTCQAEIDKINSSNRLVISKRPYFMRWLYSDYNRDYRRYRKAKEKFCYDKTGIKLDDLLKMNKENLSQEEKRIYSIYLRNNPLLDTDCLMNKICHHMEKSSRQIRENHNIKDSDSLIDLIKGNNLEVENLEEKLDKMDALYKKYKKYKQTLAFSLEDGSEEKFKTIEQYNKIIRQEAYSISPNIRELANLAVAICYVGNKDRGFVWNLFGEGIIENIKEESEKDIFIPFLDDDGDIEYMGNKYSMKKVSVSEGEEKYYDYTL